MTSLNSPDYIADAIALGSLIVAITAIVYTWNSNSKIRHERRVEQLAKNIRQIRTYLVKLKNLILSLNDEKNSMAGEGFYHTIFRLSDLIDQSEETNLDVDLSREAPSLLGELQEIAKICSDTDEAAKKKEVIDANGSTNRPSIIMAGMRMDKNLHNLIIQAESEAEHWLIKNT